MSKYLLAHDLGTSGNKVTLFDTDGNMIDSKVYTYNTNYFNNGWVEQNADDWWNAVCITTREIVKSIDPSDIIGVSFSGQMMGCLCVDSDGNPLRPSIIWADLRAQEEEIFLKSIMEEEKFYKITGHRPSASYSLAKLLWIRNNEPDIYNRTFKMLNSKDYIIFKLTDKFVTDYSDASGTNLLDINKLQWSEEIINLSSIDKNKLPEIKHSVDVAGYITKEAAKLTGLKEGIPVVCGGGDGAMAAVGALCIKPGTAFGTIGTSAWNAITTEKPLYDENLRTFNWVHVVPGHYVPCGTMQTAGASLSWLKNEIAKYETENSKTLNVSPYELINQLVSESQPCSNGLIFLPYLLGERSPRWDKDVRGAFIGLKMETKRKDLMRSVLEGVALNLNVILDIFRNETSVDNLVLTGGGAKSEVWAQILANIYNTKISIPDHIEEATSMGAAVTAGVGIGIYSSFDIINKFIKIKKVIEPDSKTVKIYDEIKPVFDECYLALEAVYKRLSQLQNVHCKE